MKLDNNHCEVGWQVDGEFFVNKVKAMEKANWDASKVSFYFRDQALSTVDFSQEPDQSWEQILAESCQNLRLRARHLCLWFSGGSDSLTVLRTFEKNNIRLDELIFYDRVYGVYDYWATESRYIQQVMYDFQKIQPWCKISIIPVDYINAQRFYEQYQEDWIYQPYAHLRFAKNMKYHMLKNNNQIVKHCEDPGRVDIFGREKPRLILYQNKWYTTFYDCFEFDSYWVGMHHFYWDDPKILVKQAHMSARFFESLPGFDQAMLHRIQSNQPGEIYKQWCRAIGLEIPSDIVVSHGLNKSTNNRAKITYEGSKMEKFSREHDKKIFGLYESAFQYIFKNYDLGKNHEHIGNILSKTYYLKEFTSNNSPGDIVKVV
jgi:hypothetical protein